MPRDNSPVVFSGMERAIVSSEKRAKPQAAAPAIAATQEQARAKRRMAADDDDLITIVDVTDPDDPSFSDVKTRRRPLTDAELASLKATLEKVGAYRFFSMEFNFADGPAVKEFIDTVQIDEYKRTKQRKIVQESMKGVVAGREVSIDGDLIERTFGLVDDGENVSKPKGETNGLHAFYIKPKYLPLCQNYRGVSLKLFKSEYSYFVNMAYQIQTYCCGSPKEQQITLTQYRAVDLMIRGKPVNWNRYLLQNFQDKLRKYKAGPCPLYFGGTLTALIYKALNIDYNLVNKPLLISPQTPERIPASDDDRSSRPKRSADKSKKPSASASRQKKEVVRTTGAMTRSQRMLAAESFEPEVELPVTRSQSHTRRIKSVQQAKKRKQEYAKQQKETAAKRRKNNKAEPPVVEDEDETDEAPSSPETSPPSSPSPGASLMDMDSTPFGKGALSRRASQSETLGEEIVLHSKPRRITKLYAQATGSPMDMDSPSNTSNRIVPLTASKNLWDRYEQFNTLQSEFQLEHIVSKQMLEQALEKVQELEDALKSKDERVSELENSITHLEKELDTLRPTNQVEASAPLKLRLKMGKVSEQDSEQIKASSPAAAGEPAAAAAAAEPEHAEEQAAKDTELVQEDETPEKEQDQEQEEAAKEQGVGTGPEKAAESAGDRGN